MKNLNVLLQLATLTKEKAIHSIFYFGTFNDRVQKVKNDNPHSIITRDWKDGLDYLPPKLPNCHSCGCLLGELPGIDHDWYFEDNGNLSYKNCSIAHLESVASLYFDLTEKVIEFLFYPDYQYEARGKDLTEFSSLEEVQENLQWWLKNNGYEKELNDFISQQNNINDETFQS